MVEEQHQQHQQEEQEQQEEQVVVDGPRGGVMRNEKASWLAEKPERPRTQEQGVGRRRNGRRRRRRRSSSSSSSSSSRC